MVDVSGKVSLCREALAEAVVKLQVNTLRLIQRDAIGKGNVLAAARLAGIMGAKKTAELIPLCHPLSLTHCEINFDFPGRNLIRLRASARITDRTGVEMEALVAVTLAALTIYDMCKAVDKKMRITGIRLVRKTKTPAR